MIRNAVLYDMRLISNAMNLIFMAGVLNKEEIIQQDGFISAIIFFTIVLSLNLPWLHCLARRFLIFNYTT